MYSFINLYTMTVLTPKNKKNRWMIAVKVKTAKKNKN